MTMNQKYIITIGYTKLAFDDREIAMRAYAMLMDSTPITSASCYPHTPPESMKSIDWVREAGNTEIELKRVDASKFALHMTDSEYREKCKPRPTEIDGEARLVDESRVAAIAGPSGDDIIDVDLPL
jgi:hypothetical protein